jgi:hypothetical protein
METLHRKAAPIFEEIELRVAAISFSKRFQFHDPRLVSYSPGDNLLGMLAVICFDDRPSAMSPIMASPFEVMEISRRVDLLDNRIAIACIVW